MWNQVKTRKKFVTDAATFVTAAVGMANVTVSELQQMEIAQRNARRCLSSVFEHAKLIKGLSSVHFLRMREDEIVTFVINQDGRQHAPGPNGTDQDDTAQVAPAAEICRDDGEPKVGDWYAVD